MKLRNAMEDHVVESYASVVRHFVDFCNCEICKEDAIVYALNRLPPRYVATLEGGVVTEVSLDRQQGRAPIDVAVMEGIKRVSQSPRCGRAAGKT